MAAVDMYLWLKAFHLVAVIAWMAGLLYLPRLMVYHATAPAGSEAAAIFKVMERRLLRAIMTPAMVAAVGLGLWLMVEGGFAAGELPFWLGLKFLLVGGLIAVHVLLAWHVRQFARDENRQGAGYFRVINEVPAVLMLGIVIAAVVKPG
jgi:protoporphyrinogen IX oxidase